MNKPDVLEPPRRRRNNKKKVNKSAYCSNCGIFGHLFKQCHEPTTSFGVINLRVQIEGLDNTQFQDFMLNTSQQQGIEMDRPEALETFCLLKDKVHFLMIRRKHTLGFMEFVRGHYRVDNVDGIVFLFRQMTPQEIQKIGESTFEDLWQDLWNHSGKQGHEHEYETSKKKFEQLVEDDELLNLSFYVKNVNPRYEIPEWGFPKGRRNFRESDLECAAREFEEETSFISDHYSVLKDLPIYDEEFIGTNGIRYRHVYYVAFSHRQEEIQINDENIHQINEIGDIGWFSYEEAISMIRPYHTERKKLLTKLYINIQNALIEYLTQQKKVLLG